MDAEAGRSMRGGKLALGMIAAAVAAAGALSASAQAQGQAPASPAASSSSSGSSGRSSGLSSNEPVDITADEAEVRQQERISIWRGNVEAIQGQNRLRTPQLTVYFAPKQPEGAPKPANDDGSPGRSIERMEAEGPVYFVTPTQTAKGSHGVYTAADDTIVLTGDVVLVQDRNVARGDKLTVNQKTGQSVLVSNAKGRGASNRVRGVFYPNQSQANAAAPAPPTQGGSSSGGATQGGGGR